MTNLTTLFLAGNPLTTLVLSEPMAATLSNLVASLKSSGVNVFTYPLDVQLIRIREPIGAFQFAVSGPPSTYTVLASTNLANWDPIGSVSNPLGKIVFTDEMSHNFPQRFYRVAKSPNP